MSNLTEKEEKEILNLAEDEIYNRLIGGYEAPEETVVLQDIGVALKLKGLTDKELGKVKKTCTYTTRENGWVVTKFNDEEYDSRIIIAACKNIDFNSPKLLDPLGLSSGVEFLRRKFPAGVIAQLVNKVLELSGYGDDGIKNVDAKN